MTYTRAPGFRASWPDLCARCNIGIIVGDRVVASNGHLIHVECASGFDDE